MSEAKTLNTISGNSRQISSIMSAGVKKHWKNKRDKWLAMRSKAADHESMRSGASNAQNQGRTARSTAIADAGSARSEVTAARDSAIICSKLYEYCHSKDVGRKLAGDILRQATVEDTETREPVLANLWLHYDTPKPETKTLEASLYASLKYENQTGSAASSEPKSPEGTKFAMLPPRRPHPDPVMVKFELTRCQDDWGVQTSPTVTHYPENLHGTAAVKSSRNWTVLLSPSE